jgi:hypothetical protein
VGVLTQHCDEGIDNETNNKQHLSEGSPEFRFTIPLHSHYIDNGVKYHDDSYNGSSGDSVAPEVNDHIASCHFERHQDRLEDEEVPTSLVIVRISAF